MKNILVTGSNGQLGNEIRVLSNDYKDLNFIFTDVAELDICSYNAIEQFTKDMEIDFIINCAAYTAVDKAESDIALCNDINSNAVGNLGKLANKKGASVIHVSTDYVYSGSSFKPYNENDETSPVSVYGKTKLDGENQLFDNCHSSVVLRTSWLYSEFGNNFVKTMYRLGSERESLGVIFDQVGTPTYALDLAKAILDIITSEKFVPGIYNYSNEGVCSWYDFALKIHEIAGIKSCKVSPLETIEYPTAATRPYYSVMNKKKIRLTYSMDIPHWEVSLKRCMKNMNLTK